MSAQKPLPITDGRYRFLLGGMNARTTHGNVTLQVEGDSFVLSAPGKASHTLAIATTDATRLDAHWQAYCAANAAEPAPTVAEIPNTWGGPLYMVTMADGSVYQGRASNEQEAIALAVARAAEPVALKVKEDASPAVRQDIRARFPVMATRYVMQDGAYFFLYEDAETERLKETVTCPGKVRDFDIEAAENARAWFINVWCRENAIDPEFTV